MSGEMDYGRKAGAARKNSAARGKAPKDNPFINVTLTAEQEQAKHEFASAYPQLFNMLDEAVDNGLSITIKYDDYSSSYSCFARTADPDSINAELVLTGRGGTTASALREVLFLAASAPDGDWRALRNPSKRSYSDDTF